MSPETVLNVHQLLDRKKLIVSAYLDPLNTTVLEAHSPEIFQRRARFFAKQAVKTFKNHRSDLFDVAHRIQDLKRKNWINSPEIAKLWFRVTNDYVLRFSEHPSKKVGCVIVNANNEMIAWGFNRIPSHLPRAPEYYAEGFRKNYIVCAEREALARYQSLEINLFAGRALPTGDKERLFFDEEIRETVLNYSDTLRYMGNKKPLPPGSVIFISNLPCTACTAAILPHRPAAIVADFEAGSHFKRAGSRRENYRTLTNAGIVVLDINKLAA